MKHLILVSFMFTGFVNAEEPNATSLPETLKGIASSLFKALQDENIEKCMGLFHPDSPNRSSTQQKYESTFPSNEFVYELKEFSYFGKDEKFAAARFIQSFGIRELNGKKVTDPRMATVEMMMLFKQLCFLELLDFLFHMKMKI